MQTRKKKIVFVSEHEDSGDDGGGGGSDSGEAVSDKTRGAPRREPSSRSRQDGGKVPVAKGGVAVPFPWRLHDVLEYSHEHGLQNILAWSADGKEFSIRNSGAFVKRIMPRFFSQTKYASFQRQLNLYGFQRNRKSKHSCYHHDYFVRGQKQLLVNMVRCKIKGTGPKRKDPIEKLKSTIKSKHDNQKNKQEPAPITPVSSYDVLDVENMNELDSIPLLEEDYDVEEGELLFFEGSPFHLLERTKESEMELDMEPSLVKSNNVTAV